MAKGEGDEGELVRLRGGTDEEKAMEVEWNIDAMITVKPHDEFACG